MSDAPVEFRLFGGVDADRGGRAVDLGHPRQRCVLAVLLAEANGPVSVGELIGRVWAGAPPVRARESLQSYLTRLRRALPDVPITRTGAGYLISVDESAIDLHRFRALAVSARQTGDPARLEAALAVWRGEPFAGLDVPCARSPRAALALERATIELADTLLRLGRHDEVLPALTARVELDPLDERLAGQYLLALYRAGRQGDALRHYERVLLDNAADPAQVVPLLPGSATCTVLTTSRNRMINLVTAHGATPLALDILSEVDAGALLAARLGADRLDREPGAVADILASCAGLPVALGIVAGRALEHGAVVLLRQSLFLRVQPATTRRSRCAGRSAACWARSRFSIPSVRPTGGSVIPAGPGHAGNKPWRSTGSKDAARMSSRRWPGWRNCPRTRKPGRGDLGG